MEPLLTAPELAKILKIEDVKKIYRLPIKKTRVGHRVRYAPGDVRLYLGLHTDETEDAA